MRLSIKQTIYQAVLSNRWLDVEYVNVKKEQTHFCLGVQDVDMEKGRLYCDIFNPFKSTETLRKKDDRIYISIEGIKKARVVEQSFYLTDEALSKRLSAEHGLFEYLEADQLENNILCYLSDCYKLDNDPYLKESVMLDGIDVKTLKQTGKVALDDDQFAKLIDVLFKRNRYDAEQMYRYVDLAINSFSIDINDKQYVVAYYKLNLNFKDKTLHVSDKPTIDKSFLIDDRKISLTQYLDMSPEDFASDYAKDEKKRELIDAIEENYNGGEKTNTRPTIFLIERKSSTAVDVAFESISEMEKQGKLTQPLKAFFGRIAPSKGTKKDPAIVVFDKGKVNIDQMRVVYNSMVNHVTYVQGPPGTGKTETIFNVILSAYANDKTLLICSNNNHPIDDIAKRLRSSFRREGKGGRLPFLRLGNANELEKAISQIREDIEFAKAHEKTNANEDRTNQSKNTSIEAFSGLRDLLSRFEERTDICERMATLAKMKSFANSDRITKEIDKQIDVLKGKLESLPYVKNEDLGEYIVSACENKAFQNYIYYSCLIRFKKLLSPTNKDLRDIAAIEDVSEAGIELGKYLKDDKNLRRLEDIYPIILCTNLSADRLGSPVPHFDLCIMDEAGQCNVAVSLISIVRGTDLLLVGDTNQLQPVTVLETAINERLKSHYGVKDEYDYMRNSILSTMKSKDNNSKSIMLRYHYRCGKRIAGFSNQRFYGGQLKLENNLPDELIYCNVRIKNYRQNRNSYAEEALAVVDLIEKNHYEDVGIVTPFVNQANLINRALQEKGIQNVSAGTIHTLQGSEKSTIIFSAALSIRTGKKTMDWVKDNHELINVGVTRAKKRFIFVGDKEAIDVQSKGEINDIKALSDYVHSQGECVIPQIEDRSFANFSNDSNNEKEFFETITPYFNKRRNKLRIERNVAVSKAIKSIRNDDEAQIGKKEFDVIVQAAEGVMGRYRTIVVFEVDGGEHVASRATAARDRIKENICKSYGIKLIRIANSQVKDYELIIALFECVINRLPDIDQAYIQGSLFSEDTAWA